MFTVPNVLTALRLVALPFVIVLHRTGRAGPATLLFVAAMLTDCFDGWLARKLNQTSTLGLYLDPAVDKIVILALFYEFGAGRLLPMSIPHLFLVRELLLNGVRAAAASQGCIVGANWMGKTKAGLQSILIAGGLAMPLFAAHVYPDNLSGIEETWRAGCRLVLVLSWVFLGTFMVRNRHLFRQHTDARAAPHRNGVRG